MIVLVTGASGFLGRAVASHLVASGHAVRTLQRRPSGVDGATDVLGSITAPHSLTRALEGADGVVHLAAKVSLTGPPQELSAKTRNVTSSPSLRECHTILLRGYSSDALLGLGFLILRCSLVR